MERSSDSSCCSAAIGATSGRLARLLALEGIVIGTAATIAGLIGAQVALQLLGESFERFLERRVPGGLDAFAVDGVVVLGAVIVGIAVTVLATVAPALAMRNSASPDRAGSRISSMARDMSSFSSGLDIMMNVPLLVFCAASGNVFTPPTAFTPGSALRRDVIAS